MTPYVLTTFLVAAYVFECAPPHPTHRLPDRHTFVWTPSDHLWLPIGYLLATYWLPTGYLLATYWLPIGYLLATYCYLLATYWLPIGYLLATYCYPLATHWLPIATYCYLCAVSYVFLCFLTWLPTHPNWTSQLQSPSRWSPSRWSPSGWFSKDLSQWNLWCAVLRNSYEIWVCLGVPSGRLVLCQPA